MIYLDSSVALAHLLGESKAPRDDLWSDDLISSRLLEYEIWVRIHARGIGGSLRDSIETVLGVVDLLEMSPPILDRALQPFAVTVRTLDALHLASIEHLRANGKEVELATYDDRMAAAARALGIPLAKI
jgi:predicted nucleic acid-binding protein